MAIRNRNRDFPCPYCHRDFNRDTSLDQHIEAMHPNGGVLYNRARYTAPNRAPANDSPRPSATMQDTATAREPDTNRTNPTEQFVVDFFTPHASHKCKACGAMNTMPISGLCPACDPLLLAMAEAATAKATATARASETKLLADTSYKGGVAEAAANFFRGHGGNGYDPSERGFGCYDH